MTNLSCYNFVATQTVPDILQQQGCAACWWVAVQEVEIGTWGQGLLKSSWCFRSHHLRLRVGTMNLHAFLPFLVSMSVSPESWARISPWVWGKHRPLPLEEVCTLVGAEVGEELSFTNPHVIFASRWISSRAKWVTVLEHHPFLLSKETSSQEWSQSRSRHFPYQCL